MIPDSQLLRQSLRARRRSVPDAERQAAAQAVAGRVANGPLWDAARRIAAYWACDGELDPMPLLERAWAADKQVYLPVLVGSPPSLLQFAPFQADRPLRRNRFNIPEPDAPPAEWLPPAALDMVATPLVAFDATGTRLGMGGGFYDRSFAFLRDLHYQGCRPCLLGLGYEFQRQAELSRQPWDVPLEAAVTETALYRFAERGGGGR